MAAPTVEELSLFLHQGSDPATSRLDLDVARLALNSATDLVKDYTRGRGFDFLGIHPTAPALARVILLVAARLVTNPDGFRQQTIGGESYTYAEPGFVGFTLGELAVLNNYRRRAA